MGSDQQNREGPTLDLLWERVRSGDQEALEKLFSRMFDSLYKYGYRIIPNSNHVRDAIQEVYYQLWKYHRNLDTPESVRAYLFVSLRRELLNQKESRQRREEVNQKYVSEEFDPLLNYRKWDHLFELKDQESKELKKAIKNLTSRQREVIYLKFFEGLSTTELSEVLQIRAQSIYNLVYDALHNLRSFLDN
ncbi:MAG: RNA polymerase sigma factor [Bacteroidota bacterium]